jgi:hypothetical protein
MPAEQLVLAFHDDKKFCFERAPVRSESTFGGPMIPQIEGVEYGPKPLHMIAELSWMHMPALSEESHINKLPLIYGMHYSGCTLRYRVGGAGIELLEIEPCESLEDWPYANFPPLLPYIPLRLSDVPTRASYAKFVDAFGHSNLDNTQRADLVAIVPPPASIGLSLWGMGDGEDVMIVFECDLKQKEVLAYNVTT